MKKFYFIYLFSLFITSKNAMCQDQLVSSTISPHANVASLAKFAETPVDLHTGVADINVPLHIATGKKLSVPVFLNYHASGIKVDEQAGWVGLGFALQSGGMITRVMRGRPDEGLDGYFEFASTVPNSTDNIAELLKGDLAEGDADMLPDLFYYNIGSDAGKFVFDNQLQPSSLLKKDLKISVNNTSSMDFFNIVAPDGTTYLFDNKETTTTRVRGNPQQYISTWYLTKIISADSTDVIFFTYASFPSYEYTSNQSWVTRYYYNVPGGSTKANHQVETEDDESFTSITNLKVLESISYASGRMDFETSARTDDPDARKLDAIVIYNKNPWNDTFTEDKRIQFNYSYFSNVGPGTRLRLDNIRDERPSGAVLPATQFTYASLQLPAVGSKAQDHWGYYNGASSNTNLIPETIHNGQTISTNDREPDDTKTGAFMLHQIISPLGGITGYTFESNTYLESSVEKIGPGMRIKKVTNVDPCTNIEAQTNYDYDNPSSGVSSGVLLNKPVYNTVMGVRDFVNGSVVEYNCLLITANPTGLGTFPETSVVYNYVSTTRGGSAEVAGKTVSKFSTSGYLNPGFPYVPEDNLSEAGNLEQVDHYAYSSGNLVPVGKVENSYTVDEVNFTQVKGLKVAYNKVLLNGPPLVATDFIVRNYFAYSKFRFLDETVTTTYESDGSGAFTTQKQNFYFDESDTHLQLTKVRTETSDNDKVLWKEFTYPPDYPATGVMGVMQSLNMVVYPVETRTILEQGGNSYVIDYNKTDFYEWFPGRVYPQFIYRPKIGAPVLKSTFLSNPSAYAQLAASLNAYTQDGILTESKAEGGEPRAAIVDKRHQAITEVTPATADQVAYSSFESSDFGNWNVTAGTYVDPGEVNLDMMVPSTTVIIDAGQTINFTYSVTKTAGPNPVLTFTQGATVIERFLNLPSGSGNAVLTAGTWHVEVTFDTNVSAFSVEFTYTNTEDHPLNRSADNRTGSYSLILENSHTVSKTSLPAGTYTLTYYQKSGTVSVSVSGGAQVVSTETLTTENDGWTPIRKTINIANTSDIISVTGSGPKVDELRLCPQGSFMVTTCYDERGLLTTTTDANLRSQFSEYDEWGRLILVRDHDRNIIRHQEYKLAGN